MGASTRSESERPVGIHLPDTALLIGQRAAAYPDASELALAPTIPADAAPREVDRARGAFAVYGEHFALTTGDEVPGFYDLTELAQAIVGRAGVVAGTLT